VSALRGRGFSVHLAMVAAGGLVLRLIYVLVLSPDTRGTGDALFFHAQANLIGSGHGFIEPTGFLLSGQSHPTVFRPPLFSYVLGLVSALGGESVTAHRVAGCLIGVVTIVALGLAGRRLAGARVGLAAAALGACYPVLIAADGAVMSESLYAALVAVTVACALWLRDEPRALPAAALGVAVGLTALTRSEALALVVLLAVPVAWRTGPATRRRLCAITVAAAVIVVAPWTIRNYSEFHRLVPISGSYGTLIAGANCDRTYSGPDLGAWDIDCTHHPGSPAGELDRNSDNAHRALDYMGDHLGEVPGVMAVRVLRTADLWQPWRQAEHAEGREPTFAKLGVLAFYLLVPLAIAGAVMLRRSRAPMLALAAPVILTVAISLTAWGVPRFRAAAEIPLVLCAAVALTRARGSSAPAAGAPARTN
jgi:4-amino-4-deoxy-L-arabinose transferase-like glycosyltransferase